MFYNKYDIAIGRSDQFNSLGFNQKNLVLKGKCRERSNSDANLLNIQLKYNSDIFNNSGFAQKQNELLNNKYFYIK